MGYPDSSVATLRPELAQGLEQFNLAMDRQGFIGHRILPVFELAEASGIFPKITLESLLQNKETVRAPRTGYSRGDWDFTTDTFATQEHGWEEPIDDNEAKMYRNFFDFEQIATQRAFDMVLREQERAIATAIYNTTTWTGATLTTAITHEWDDATNAVPISDINAAKQKVWDLTGLWPNALVINRKQFNNLRTLDDIKDTIASSGAGYPTRATDITREQLAACFDLDYILIGGAAKNTANEGQTRSLSQIWSDEYAMVCRIATTNDMSEPCIGRTFHWGADGSNIGGHVETYRDETVRSDIVRCRMQIQNKILYAQCGHLLSNVTT